MEQKRVFRLVAFSVFLCTCLAFVAISSMQAGGAKPTREQWTVTLPGPGDPFNLYGDGSPYVSDSYVTVQHLQSDSGTHSFFLTVNKNPLGRYIGIQNIRPLTLVNLDTSLNYCFFPYNCNKDLESPGCIECFLNQQHPQDYIHILTSFNTGVVDLDSMEIGESVEVAHFTCDLWNTNTGFADEYHSLITSGTSPSGQLAMTLKKVGTNTWTLSISNADFKAHESWKELIDPRKKNLGSFRNTNYVEAPGTLSVLMTWTRTIR